MSASIDQRPLRDLVGTGEQGTIYLVHFSRPFQHARHYLGWTSGTLEERFARHLANSARRRGSALMHAVLHAGIAFKIVRTWPGDRFRERQLKGNSHSPRCPICCGRVSYDDALDLLTLDRGPLVRPVS